MKKLTALFLSLLLALTLLTACGGSNVSQAADYAMKEEMAMEAPAAMMDNAATLSGAGETGSTVLPENRKWIVTVNMDAETEDLDTLLKNLEQEIRNLKGYVEDQELYNGSTYSTRRHRNARLTVRIPAGDVDAFTGAVSGIANVVSTNVSRDDITLQYVDTESRVTALKTQETRLLELLAQADTTADLLEIESRLSDVRYELESYSSRLRLYDNQVDYATVYLYISEVQEYTPVAEKTVWERIRDGFTSSLEGVWDGAVDFLVWVIANSPYLLVWGCVIALAVVLLRKFRIFPFRRARRERKAEEPKKSEE